jgi:hypothetical protein
MDYLSWNDKIAAHFFNDRMAGRDVLIFVNEQILEELGADNGADNGSDVNDFVQSVKCGPDWVTSGNVCKKAFDTYRDWRQRQLSYPPYVAYLALFVYAATINGDFDGKAYYPRLRKILSAAEERRSSYPDFNRIVLLWRDLQEWTKTDKKEELGRFTALLRGKWVNVGMPLSQTVLSEEERRALPYIFEKASLDPLDPPSDEALRWKLVSHGRKLLRSRTQELLKGKEGDDNPALRDALLDFILLQLSEAWEEPESLSAAPQVPRLKRTVWARICLERLDPLSGTVDSRVRIKTNETFPSDGLHFQVGERSYTCHEGVAPGWSSKLKQDGQTKTIHLEASELDWLKGAAIMDEENEWEVLIKGARVKLFLKLQSERLPGWVECQRPERGCEFLVACHEDAAKAVADWGETSCDYLRRISTTGLPKHWALFEGAGARESCPEFSVLTFSTRPHLDLEGGIKARRGNEYLRFARPTIVVDGCSGSELVTIDSKELNRVNQSMSKWQIPDDLPVDKTLDIAVFDQNDEEPVRGRAIRLVDPFISDLVHNAWRRDRTGEVMAENDGGVFEGPYVSGAVVHGNRLEEMGDIDAGLPTYLSDRIVFVGRIPGDVVDWPHQHLPTHWDPVWAISQTGKDAWRVYYCGTGGADDEPVSEWFEAKKGTFKTWKEMVWTKRRSTAPPKPSRLASLWRRYQKVASFV